MTLYVRTDYVPEGYEYIVSDKLYEVKDINCTCTLGNVINEDGEITLIRLQGKCNHIGKEWEQVILEKVE